MSFAHLRTLHMRGAPGAGVVHGRCRGCGGVDRKVSHRKAGKATVLLDGQAEEPDLFCGRSDIKAAAYRHGVLTSFVDFAAGFTRTPQLTPPSLQTAESDA